MTTTDEKPNLAMSAEEYASSCGLSLTYVYNCCRAGTLPGGLHPVKAGRRYLISRKLVETWLSGENKGARGKATGCDT